MAVEPCVVNYCNTLVPIRYDRNGGLPIRVNGYSGLTDDGDAVCEDHFCPTCGNFHHDVEAFEACEADREFNGRPTVDLTLCGVDNPHAVLAAFAR